MQGWRTLLFNIAAAVLTVFVGYDWPSLLASYPWAAPLVVALANMGLRFVTTTPVGTKP